MSRAFLLRYQENLLANETEKVTCGTRTLTKVQTEQADSDVVSDALALFTGEAYSSGTGTQTRISRESGDQDRTERQIKLFTKSGTLI